MDTPHSDHFVHTSSSTRIRHRDTETASRQDMAKTREAPPSVSSNWSELSGVLRRSCGGSSRIRKRTQRDI